MFENLRKAYLQEREQYAEHVKIYIEKGVFPTWREQVTSDPDRGLREHSTATRWNQYKAGVITREKAVELAQKRFSRQHEKDVSKKVRHIENVAAAPDLKYICVYVQYKKSSYWGYCPSVEVDTNNGLFTGYASGCGYDKESAAVAEAFNKDLSILKALYTLKENGLVAGLSDYSQSACTGVDNRNICGYGAGYSVLPYFEGGVGVNCFWAILKKCGFETKCRYTKSANFYNVDKMEASQND